ncbi:hypothetical protein PVV74_11605 [Roseovarius sp. SK2]|uniref:hypothetical protein n=1 Tax=Roseovarius TaxID=74030 RepID=UPI00237C1DBB|nr:hypothetical protein [Roseovarius sp. SK2]MDD9726102.1 hypothetical protein [Roseovarius sp. SK2]
MPAGRPRNPIYDTEEFTRLWYSRLTLKEIAHQLGVSANSVHSAGRHRGLPKRSTMRPGDEVAA